MLRVGTTFSGIGAPEQSLKNLGVNFVVKWACDSNKFAAQTYAANHKCEMFLPDVLTINEEILPEVDLYAFGFPCQDVSVAGRQQLERGRTRLVWRAWQIVKAKAPKYILFENVKALASPKFSDFFEYVLGYFQKDYDLTYAVLNAKDFGVPQNRERLFCVGVRKDLNQKFVMPNRRNVISPSLRNVLEYAKDESLRVTTSYQAQNLEPDPNKCYAGALRTRGSIKRLELRESDVSNCLTTQINDSLVCVNGFVRRLSVKEMKRLQGFPDSFIVPTSYNQASKLFGNSICVPVLEDIFIALLK
jgi:DNA (cytosine-5)-methyltransferase 1